MFSIVVIRLQCAIYELTPSEARQVLILAFSESQ